MTDLCSSLDWDSNFFGRHIARVNVNHLSGEQADQVLAWCTQEKIDCLYFLAESDDAETVRTVEAHGFALVDIRITLDWRGAIPAQPDAIRLSQPDDLPALKALARTTYRDSRFYYDDHFPKERSDALYERWIERDCAENTVLVIERESEIAGYVTCLASGSIGLLGVSEKQRGQGIGQALVQGALHWFGTQGIAQVEVITQGRNIAAQRIYQRCGFVTSKMQLWYHRWFTQN